MSSSDRFNPNTGRTYYNESDVDKDAEDHPWCKEKIRRFWKRIQIQLTHEEVRKICGIWGCINAEELFRKMDSLSDAELKAYVDRVRGRKKAQLESAVLVTAEAGVT